MNTVLFDTTIQNGIINIPEKYASSLNNNSPVTVQIIYKLPKKLNNEQDLTDKEENEAFFNASKISMSKILVKQLL
ncbi:MAG: hypothetical protein LBC49_02090 [Bacteroidales bacterium]|jgi:hypothetical protein|nr:hypothetical protein [Bacteroidales bacterium]